MAEASPWKPTPAPILDRRAGQKSGSGPIMNHRLVWVLAAFFVFFVLTNPEAAGPQARAFFGWLGELGTSIGVFLDGLFSGGPEPVVDPTPDPTVAPGSSADAG